MSSGRELIFTPIIDSSKLPILVLITGYCHGRYPSRSTPPILSTLVELIEGSRNTHDNINDDDIVSEFFPPILLILERLQRSIESFFKKADTKAESKIKNYVFQVQSYLLSQLWGIHDIDEFYSFIKKSQLLLVEKEPLTSTSGERCFDDRQKRRRRTRRPLHSSSFLGKFVSSISIATSALMFDETVKLWQAFVDYRAKSEETWKYMVSTHQNLTVHRIGKKRRSIDLKDKKTGTDNQRENKHTAREYKVSGSHILFGGGSSTATRVSSP